MNSGKEKIAALRSDHDDDPTAELEALSDTSGQDCKDDGGARSGERTFNSTESDAKLRAGNDSVPDLTSELQSRARIIASLQFEIEQHRSIRNGLETEIRVLEDVVTKLTEELKIAREKHVDAIETLKERDAEIEMLRSQLSDKEQELKAANQSRGQLNDVTRAGSKSTVLRMPDIVSNFNKIFDSKTKTRRLLDRQIEKTNTRNARLEQELKSKRALIRDYERVIEELKSRFPEAGQRPDTNDQPRELALLVPMSDEALNQHSIRAGRLTIGSSSDNDIQIKSEFISRHHVEIVSSSRDSILRDLGSTNGTYVNSNRIKRHALRHGDSITIGKHHFRFVSQNSGGSK
jgi:myosin heavy subunit